MWSQQQSHRNDKSSAAAVLRSGIPTTAAVLVKPTFHYTHSITQSQKKVDDNSHGTRTSGKVIQQVVPTPTLAEVDLSNWFNTESNTNITSDVHRTTKEDNDEHYM
ncbi:hypothetical protein HAX54_046547, partial [Datura stramonium]|nr:hypothetical protein [Datura stramonium]